MRSTTELDYAEVKKVIAPMGEETLKGSGIYIYKLDEDKKKYKSLNLPMDFNDGGYLLLYCKTPGIDPLSSNPEAAETFKKCLFACFSCSEGYEKDLATEVVKALKQES